jgi:hypothetical protein
MAMTAANSIDSTRKTATRLLTSSARNSYSPGLDIDWAAPVELDLKFMPFERTSLYGTAIWDRMTEQQKVELSRQELASVASTGPCWMAEKIMAFLDKQGVLTWYSRPIYGLAHLV